MPVQSFLDCAYRRFMCRIVPLTTRFLQVQSHETPIRSVPASEYSYTIEEGRLLAHRQPAPAAGLYGHGPHPVTPTEMLTYRGAAYASCANKPCCAPALPTVPAYSPPYPADFYNLSSYTPASLLSGGSQAIQTAPAQAASRPGSSIYGSDLYPEADAPYGYGKATGLTHRQALAVVTEHQNSPFANVVPSLPSSASPERFLPSPSSRSLSTLLSTPLTTPLTTAPGNPYTRTMKGVDTSGTGTSSPISVKSSGSASSDNVSSAGSYTADHYDMPFPPPGTILLAIAATPYSPTLGRGINLAVARSSMIIAP